MSASFERKEWGSFDIQWRRSLNISRQKERWGVAEGGGGVGSFDGGAISSKYGNPRILLRSKPNLGFHFFYFTLYLFFCFVFFIQE